MTTLKKYLFRFSTGLWLAMAMFIVFALVFAIYVQSEKQIDVANEQRFQSFLLADELRQSSDDLTRMVRSYVATGDPIYKRHFREILDIRDGKRARPVDYHLIYWDLVLQDDSRPRPAGPGKLPLLVLMRQAGFTAAEFAKLADAKNKSDALALTEYAVMQRLESVSSPTEADRNRASLMLHDSAYHQAKADIMRLIGEFYRMVDSRTAKAVQDALLKASQLRVVFIAFGMLLLLMLWRTYRSLFHILGGSLDELHDALVRLGSGDFSSRIRPGLGGKNSILAWVSETQIQLARLDAEHRRVEAKNQRLTQLYAALSQCNQSIVRCDNQQQLFLEICRAAVTFGGMKLAWIGWLDSESGKVKPVAWYGDDADYLNDIEISIHPDDPFGRGPTGTAMREDRPFWCQDFQQNPATTPWRLPKAKFDWQASASLPLHGNGRVVGAMTLYAANVNAFDEDARNLLLEMATDIDYALNNLAQEIQRRQTLAELAESRNLLRTIIDTVPLRIFWKDRELTFLGCNPAFALDAGADSPLDVIGKNDKQLAWRDLAEFYQNDDRQVMSSGVPKLFYEEPLIKPDGETVWLRTSKVPLLNSDRQTIGVLGVYQDITAIKQTELALLRSEANLNRAQAVAKIGSWRLDLKQGRLEWSAETFRIFGLPPDTPVDYRLFLSRVHPDDSDQVNNAWQAALKGAPYHLEHRIVVNGDIRWVEERAELEFDADGNCLAGVGTVQDITERKQALARIERLANYDPLTGLPNRAQLQDRVRYAVSLAKRAQGSLALMFLDLDRFKDINDTLGHSVGDALLIKLAKRLRQLLREEDTVTRLGGDEFILLLPGVDARGAAFLAQKLQEAIAEPYAIEQHNLSLTASIGIALYPGDGEDLETLSKSADAAMYSAKQEGRQGYRFFTPEMQAKATRNLLLLNALRHALTLEQLQLYYQPQVSMPDGRIIGAEALLRWRHPELGMISPAEFIPIAEDSGLILPIGEWVLRRAARQAKAWETEGLGVLTMAVNISAVQFRHPDLPDLVARVLEQEGLAPEFLELELTEGVAMLNPERAIDVINNLHARGVSMAIDDFGTGYSSLSYLKRFKVSKLKIDQSFVRDIDSDAEDRAIVRAVISLARSLGLKTIAEGVETIEQQTFLNQQGCEEMQGYLFSPPLPANQFAALLKRHPHAE
ncbi:EAL domain-containing protein [Methylomonas sp. SURF-2]|uniref:EAL domain-containing protein n=1 Tax=Methylomonas subterranea TaxID=2952225 RepID=A0ABT1TD34_9GAMM|nr:EAL domain-containing protein [Methylomonas sp. SURF-2]MCQ8103375.1 EAL domain-containing protein [Methylomonas sp. SURF-2]